MKNKKILAVLVFAFLAVFLIGSSSCSRFTDGFRDGFNDAMSSTQDSTQEGSELSATEGQETQVEEAPVTEGQEIQVEEDPVNNYPQIVYQDDVLVATFEGVSKSFGMTYLDFDCENKGNYDIMVGGTNASINDRMVQLLGGVTKLRPGKSADCKLLFGMEAAGISSLDEINTIELSIWYSGTEAGNYEHIKSDIITINLK